MNLEIMFCSPSFPHHVRVFERLWGIYGVKYALSMKSLGGYRPLEHLSTLKVKVNEEVKEEEVR